MINVVELQNFKNFRRQRIELERLTVFVGANGSGKTSVLDAIHYAVRAVTPKRDAPTGRPSKVFGWERHCDWLYARGGVGDMAISCTTSGGTFSVSATPPAGYPPPKVESFGRSRWDFRVTPSENEQLLDALRPARSLVFLHMNAAELAKPSYADRMPPRVEFDGAGVASVLAYMALNAPQDFELLVSEMRTLIPHLKGIRFTKRAVHRVEKEVVRFGDDSVERKTKREYQGDALLFDFENAENVSAQTVSEGTLMLLGLLTVLHGPTAPDILLLDDIEHGLHPLAQKLLLEVLRKLMQRFATLQILASAHSPYLLNSLEPNEVRLTTIGPDGYSICGRLTDHPRFSKWKDEMAPGEMWSLFGEKWLAEGGVAQ